MGFPMSLRWTAYVSSKPPQRGAQRRKVTVFRVKVDLPCKRSMHVCGLPTAPSYAHCEGRPIANGSDRDRRRCSTVVRQPVYTDNYIAVRMGSNLIDGVFLIITKSHTTHQSTDKHSHDHPHNSFTLQMLLVFWHRQRLVQSIVWPTPSPTTHPKLTNPAARFLCDSWATCFILLARWRIWYSIKLVIEKSRVRLLAGQRCAVTLGNYWHLCDSVIKQHNLALAQGRWCPVAENVTAGLAESNGSLSPGLWQYHLAGWLQCQDKLRLPYSGLTV